MRCFIIVSHPLQTSLNHHFAQQAKLILEAQGHDVSFVDLYAQGFDPRLKNTERASYYTPAYNLSDVAEQGQALQDAELLVLIFPTWWFGLPAMLKGWIDRLFVPGVAFDHGENFGPIKPRLKKLQRVVAITTLGSPWWVDRLVMRKPVKRILKTAIFRTCAPQSSFDYLPFYSAESPSAARVSAFEKRILKVLK